jgi:hypothetical protein
MTRSGQKQPSVNAVDLEESKARIAIFTAAAVNDEINACAKKTVVFFFLVLPFVKNICSNGFVQELNDVG